MEQIENADDGKPGVPFRTIVDQMETFDMIAFRGSDFVSNSIAAIEREMDGDGSFTHVGMVVRARDLHKDSPIYDQEKIYIFESTASGNLVDGVPAVDDGKGHLGCQMRDLCRVVPAYDVSSLKTRMAWLPLQPELRPPQALRSEMLERILVKYNNIRYAASFIDLAAAALPFMRGIRDNFVFRHARNFLFEIFCCGAKPSTWLFCSELVANIYFDIGVFPDCVNPADVMPMDFFPGPDSPLLGGGVMGAAAAAAAAAGSRLVPG